MVTQILGPDESRGLEWTQISRLWFSSCAHKSGREQSLSFHLGQKVMLDNEDAGEFCGVEVILKNERKAIHHSRALILSASGKLAPTDWEVKQAKPGQKKGKLMPTALPIASDKRRQYLVSLVVGYFQSLCAPGPLPPPLPTPAAEQKVKSVRKRAREVPKEITEPIVGVQTRSARSKAQSLTQQMEGEEPREEGSDAESVSLTKRPKSSAKPKSKRKSKSKPKVLLMFHLTLIMSAEGETARSEGLGLEGDHERLGSVDRVLGPSQTRGRRQRRGRRRFRKRRGSKTRGRRRRRRRSQ